ncbi:MAG: DUF3108 domain-containing protein [Candidatus Cloacimonadota bacterium]|nr:DUF3108 domain-containing protein [Candidatus Cloacimonadota bacterium]
MNSGLKPYGCMLKKNNKIRNLHYLKLFLLFLIAFFVFEDCLTEQVEFFIGDVTYIGVPVASANIRLESQQNFLKIIAKTKTIGVMNTIFHINNSYISTCDTDFVSFRYEKNIEQSNLSERKLIQLNSGKEYIKFSDLLSRNSVLTEIDTTVQNEYYDLFSLIFKIRQLGKGDYHFIVAANYDLWQVDIKYIKTDMLKLSREKLNCKKFRLKFKKIYDNPLESPTDVLTNNLFNERSEFFVWISADNRNLPVKFYFDKFPFGATFSLKDFWQQ